MKLVDLKIVDFINEVDSKSPAPGGGSVSALTSSIAAALVRMVAHLTFNKKKYEALSEEIREEFEEAFEKLKIIEEKLLVLVDEDTKNFNKVMLAMKLPKDTDLEKEERDFAIEAATISAIETPLKILDLSCELMTHIFIILEYGNKNTTSDIAVAALLAEAGAKGAVLNVKINMPSISNQKLLYEYKNRCNLQTAKVLVMSKQINDRIVETIG